MIIYPPNDHFLRNTNPKFLGTLDVIQATKQSEDAGFSGWFCQWFEEALLLLFVSRFVHTKSLGYAQFADLKARLLDIHMVPGWIFHVYAPVNKDGDGQSYENDFIDKNTSTIILLMTNGVIVYCEFFPL
jgi:hypothetical protein